MHSPAEQTRIPVEQRFPVALRRSIDSIRELYETGKRERWQPQTDIAWAAFRAEGYDAAALAAARLTWSWRAWVEYAGLTETPATLIRLCLEAGREADPKYFLTVRNTEEAWHIECFHQYAQVLGGYVNRPPEVADEAVFAQLRDRQVLDAREHLDAFFATHSTVEDSLELALFEAHLRNAEEPVAAAILGRAVQDKQRHARFGWLYLEERAGHWTQDERARIAATVHGYLQQIELGGYHCPWLAHPQGEAARAAQITAAVGLGAASRDEEAAVIVDTIADTRVRLAELDITLPRLNHAALGSL
ncbi:hypothetical protein FOZ76_00325 [Verticiella sediminum]|uniref:Ferritin-like domain-containing protein n=1 Tax=Verticiella sediminum TaxID=1247510 RepID=A0A556B231_9BURK|nr:hypothetical protein [Verticiella sediminum]TSH99214.1 hypothetical protein FOZ76_00325 [Verticiella sediminum]